MTSSSSPTGLQDAYADAITDPARTEPPATCVGNAKRQVIDLPLVVEVGRLELPCLAIRVCRPHAAPMADSSC